MLCLFSLFAERTGQGWFCCSAAFSGAGKAQHEAFLLIAALRLHFENLPRTGPTFVESCFVNRGNWVGEAPDVFVLVVDGDGQ